MSLTDTARHWLWGCALRTAASRSDVNVAMPHLRGRWSPTKAILRTLEGLFMEARHSLAAWWPGTASINQLPQYHRSFSCLNRVWTLQLLSKTSKHIAR